MDIRVVDGVLCDEEIDAYVLHVREKIGEAAFRSVKEIVLKVDGDFVDISWRMMDIPFDRIRRITGYLVGTLDRFNNGKRAEEHDRVKHNIISE